MWFAVFLGVYIYQTISRLPCSMNKFNDPITFPCGITMKNRFMLAPLTNSQSHEDGTLSDEEFNWLVMRAKGDFGLTMTCASHVQANGRGFPGQLGIFGEEHIEGHKRLAEAINSEGSISVVQLHHAGMRSPADLIPGIPVSSSPNEDGSVRGLTNSEVKLLVSDFVNAAERAKTAGYHGVELHGAHGYIICQFLSSEINNRDDEYGGSLENRARILFEMIDGIRAKCGSRFLIGVRLSSERFGIKLAETKQLCERLAKDKKIDFLDISLWDSFKYPEENEHKNKTLLDHFGDMDTNDVLTTVAGKIMTGQQVKAVLEANIDFVAIGRAAILHHDFPKKVIGDPRFESIETPVNERYLSSEGLSPIFISYMKNRWDGFVSD